jgi:hypothetical protein
MLGDGEGEIAAQRAALLARWQRVTEAQRRVWDELTAFGLCFIQMVLEHCASRDEEDEARQRIRTLMETLRVYADDLLVISGRAAARVKSCVRELSDDEIGGGAGL